MRQGHVIAALLSAVCALPAQMVPMQMDRANPEPVQHEHAGPASTSRQKAPQEKTVEAPKPAVPFGRLADGDDSNATPGPIPPTKTPLRLDPAIQEQEHPDRTAGSLDPQLPDILADVRVRPAQPIEAFSSKALAQNPTIREAEAQVRRLKAEAKQQGLWDNPEIGYEADHVRGGVYHSGEQGGYVQQVVPIGGQRSSARSAAEQRAREAVAVLDQQKARVTAAVKQAFYAALTVQAEVDLRLELLHVAEDAARTAHQLANVGQADAPDILQSEVEREQSRLDYASAQREYRKAFRRLAAASGEVTQPAAPLRGELAALPMLDGTVAFVAADASPTLRVANAAITADEAAIRAARRQQRPQLTLRAGLQQDNEPLEVAQRRVGVVGIAQAGITLPLWNRNQGGVEAAKASVAQSRAAVARTQASLRMEAENVLQDYNNAISQAKQYREELLPRAQRAYELYRQKYMSMAAAYPQVLVSQRTLFQLRLEYVHALGAAWQSALLLQNGLLSGALQQPEVVTDIR